MTMPTQAANTFTGAQNVNVHGGQINTAGRDINNNYNINNDKIAEQLKPASHDLHNPPPCMEGTRVKILDHIYKWIDDYDESIPNIMWITGGPGTGKSAIASTLVDKLSSNNWKRLGGSHFFKRDDNILGDPTVVWRTIAYDLVTKYTFLSQGIVDALDNNFRSDNIMWHYKHLIAAPLAANKEKLKQCPPVVIIDALDECKHSDALITFKKTLKDWCNLSKNIKLIITGRPGCLPTIFLEKQMCVMLKLETDPNVDGCIHDDISIYLKHSFEDHMDELQFTPTDNELKEMINRASGLFIWASTAIKFIVTAQVDDVAPREKLQKIISNQVDNGVDSLYQQILESSFGHWKHERQQIVRQLIGTICILKSSLDKKSLQKFIYTEGNKDGLEDEISRILQFLQPVISKENESIKFHHLSFVEFLMERCQDRRFQINQFENIKTGARTILNIMNTELKFNICNIESSYLKNKDIKDLTQRVKDCVPRHLQYSCRYWHLHCQDVRENTEHVIETQNNELINFLSDKFLYWLEVMSILNDMPKSIEVLTSTKIIIKDNTNAIAFIDDCLKFIYNMYVVIKQSIPHIYLSALAFSPQESIIRKHFIQLFHQLPKVRVGMDQHWASTFSAIHYHSSAVTSVAYSPEGKSVVFGSGNRCISFWNIESGKIYTGAHNYIESNYLGVSSQFTLYSQKPSNILVSSFKDTLKFGTCNSDGWVYDSMGNLVFWVPPHHRISLCGPETIQIFPHSHMWQVDLSQFACGTSWVQCMQESPGVQYMFGNLLT